MRVAVLTSLYPLPGRPFEGIFAERRWRGMRERGHEVTVIHPLPIAPPAAVARLLGRSEWSELASAPKREVRGGVPIARPRYRHLPGRALANADRFARCGVEAILENPEPDVVVADYAWPAARAASALRERGLAFVVSGRGSDVLQVAGEARLGEALATALRTAGHWCGVSQDLVEAMDRLGERSGHGVLVPNGVDRKLFTVRDRPEAREALGISTEGRLVLAVGHLIERKDPLLSLEVFLRGAPEGARFAWVGRGPLEVELAAAAHDRGLGERFLAVGEKTPEELASWYAACDVLLLTSLREGRPNVVLEALSCGRPVLATDAGGTAEILDEAQGRLVRSRDPDTLGRALAEVLAREHDPHALRFAVADYSWEASLERLEGCLRRAAAEGSPA